MKEASILKKHTIVVTGKTLPAAWEMLQKDCEIHLWEQSTPIPREHLFAWLAEADGLFSTGKVQIDEELLSYAPKLKVIAQSSVGYDNIDIAACTRRKIPVGNTPGVLVEATADLAFGLLLTAARRIHEGWNWVHEGRWQTGPLPLGIDLYGKTLGIVGMGQIGVAVAKRAQASGMRIIYHNRTRRADDSILQAAYVSFDELLAQADCIIVLTPLTPQNRGLFGSKEFAKMKPTAYFVNAARGAIVDTQALYEALKNGHIAYAAMDVTDPEPLPASHCLLTLPNILITPHIGSATQETRTAMAVLAAKNLLAGLAQKALPTCVNPEVNYID